MTTADDVRARAMTLAGSDIEVEEAIRELEAECAGKRVAAVRARQQVIAWLDSEPDQPVAMRAVELLDLVVSRLPA